MTNNFIRRASSRRGGRLNGSGSRCGFNGGRCSYCTRFCSFSDRRLSNIRRRRNHSSSFNSCKSFGGGSGDGDASHANAFSTWGSDRFCNTLFSFRNRGGRRCGRRSSFFCFLFL